MLRCLVLRMPKESQATFGVTEEELVAFAQAVSLFTQKRFGSARIKQFGLLVSLLKKLTKQVYD